MNRIAILLVLCLPCTMLYGETKGKKRKLTIPPLPKGITSFGAAVIGEHLYVYGGHKGGAHRYSNKTQSDKLQRVNLIKQPQWETIATGPRLQGLAMVAHKGKLYRIGGFTAHNAPGKKHELRSVADVARFDPAKGKKGTWEPLPSMPVPRSSHDAVVIGDTIYVVGGWKMDGETATEWHDTAFALDLSQKKLQWKALPKPPFTRRALSLGQLDGKLYAVGGMQKKGGATTRVDVYDPASRKWSQAPSLVGKGMEGFGSSAFIAGGRLYVSTYSGQLQELGKGAGKWKVAQKLRDARFFHRMLPVGHGRLISVGGASMETGKFLELEVIDLK